jgi:subtilisin family serine protease
MFILDIVAPTDVSNYAYLSLPERSRLFGGTSAAAPHAAGAAALLLSKNSSLTPDGIKELLIENALPISPPAVPSNVTGYGLINLTFATV